jgi:hypothetical protein
MRINELLTESQLEQLEEGPILNKIGSAVGKGVGTVAKGVGAVAGGVAGVGSAVKKGFTAGKQTVASGGDDPVAAPSGTPAPKQGIMGKIGSAIGNFKAGYDQTTGAPTAAPSGAAPSAQSINQQGPAGTAPAVAQTGAAGAALAKTTAAVANQTTAKAGQTVYAQVKANIDKLDKKGKQRILQLLQKSMAVPDPKPAAGTATPPATTPPAVEPAATAAPANTMANAPVSATNTAAADNPNQPPAAKKRGGKVAGQDSQTPNAIRKRNARRDTKNAAATTGGAGAFNQMAQQATQQNASKNNYGNALSEALAQRVEIHKQKMFETGLSNGTTSVFRK